MTRTPDNVGDILAPLVREFTGKHYEDLTKQFEKALDSLARQGVVELGPDHELGGRGLEIRVALILESMDLSVSSWREYKEDWVVQVPDCAKQSKPLVIEVKSGKARSPIRKDLRQLDDWVFELSGEAEIRKNVYEKRNSNRTYRWKGAIQPPPTHPTPHKGVLIYNFPLGTPFRERSEKGLGPNEQKFAQIRSFCAISLPCLLSWEDAVHKSTLTLKDFWDEVQVCAGELKHHRTDGP